MKRKRFLISLGVVLIAVIVVLALVISRAEWIQTDWIQTDKDQYLLGEEVTIHLTNPTFRTVEGGYWGIEGVYSAFRVMIVLPVKPGQTFTWTWDQSYHVFPDDSRNFTQVPAGTYTTWWKPADLRTNEPIGRFEYEFEIIEGKD